MSLEKLTQEYQTAASVLADAKDDQDQELAEVRARHIKALRLAAGAMNEIRRQLIEHIEQNSDLFARKKTQTINGVKVGFRKLKGKVEKANKEKTIKLIHQTLPQD